MSKLFPVKKINLKFEPNYPKIEYEISNLEWEPAAAYLTDVEIKNKIIISQDEDMGKNERKLEHTQDFKDYSYKFTHKPYISLKNKKMYYHNFNIYFYISNILFLFN